MKNVLNLPLRMQIGRLGILLMKVGRELQVRYANWNREFRLQFEEINEDIGEFHVSEVVTHERVLSFFSKDSQKYKQTPLIESLFNITGVANIHLYPYTITIGKGVVFTWDELRPEIEEVLLSHLTR